MCKHNLSRDVEAAVKNTFFCSGHSLSLHVATDACEERKAALLRVHAAKRALLDVMCDDGQLATVGTLPTIRWCEITGENNTCVKFTQEQQPAGRQIYALLINVCTLREAVRNT